MTLIQFKLRWLITAKKAAYSHDWEAGTFFFLIIINFKRDIVGDAFWPSNWSSTKWRPDPYSWCSGTSAKTIENSRNTEFKCSYKMSPYTFFQGQPNSTSSIFFNFLIFHSITFWWQMSHLNQMLRLFLD